MVSQHLWVSSYMMCREVWGSTGFYEFINRCTRRRAKGRTLYMTKGNHRNSFQRTRYQLACTWPELLLIEKKKQILNLIGSNQVTESTNQWAESKDGWVRPVGRRKEPCLVCWSSPQERVWLRWLKQSSLCLSSDTSWISKNKPTNKQKCSNIPVLVQKSVWCGFSNFSRDLLSNILALIHGKFSHNLYKMSRLTQRTYISREVKHMISNLKSKKNDFKIPSASYI